MHPPSHPRDTHRRPARPGTRKDSNRPHGTAVRPFYGRPRKDPVHTPNGDSLFCPEAVPRFWLHRSKDRFHHFFMVDFPWHLFSQTEFHERIVFFSCSHQKEPIFSMTAGVEFRTIPTVLSPGKTDFPPFWSCPLFWMSKGFCIGTLRRMALPVRRDKIDMIHPGGLHENSILTLVIFTIEVGFPEHMPTG
jgi:hypothetical protein